ncbi:MAG: hypothetical protein VKJ24_11010 [Synechococcales bacterium]|nr:hypothetical protein [Synechococcales bacterium]
MCPCRLQVKHLTINHNQFLPLIPTVLRQELIKGQRSLVNRSIDRDRHGLALLCLVLLVSFGLPASTGAIRRFFLPATSFT